MHILLVEDDLFSGKDLEENLTKNSHTIQWVRDGKAALTALDGEVFDMVLLDLGLPKMSGYELLSHFRQKGHKNQHTLTLVLASSSSIQGKVDVLNSGADDYMVKPCSLAEVKARILSLGRRRFGLTLNIIEHGNLKMDISSHVVSLDGEPIELSVKEFIILQKLLESRGRIVTREGLIQSYHEWNEKLESNAIEVHICKIREKFGKFGKELIKTKRGLGYIIDKI